MYKLIIILLCWVAISASVFATNGMNMIGLGPVQRSMGGANTALPLDSAIVISNPAGLTYLNRRLDLGMTYFDADVSYRAYSTGGMVSNNDKKMSSDAGNSYMPALGLVWPVNERATFGLGAYGVCGMGVDYKTNLYHNVTYTDYCFMKIAPGMGYKINDQLSIGAALNIDYATMEYNAGSVAEVPHNDGDAVGFGFNAGLLYNVSDEVSVALSYISKQDFQNFKFNTSSGRDELSFDQPQSLTAGLGLYPTSKLRIAFDVTWIDWTQTNGRNKPGYTNNNSGAMNWNMNWDDQLVYKIGLEYNLNETITLRTGYNYGRHPLDSSRAFENIAFPAIAEHHITAGAGIKLRKNLELNLGIMYAPEVDLSTSNSNQFIDRAETSMSQFAIDIGLAYRF